MQTEIVRGFYQELLNWKANEVRYTLQVQGARQVGKTFLLKKFAREEYSNYFYIDLATPDGAAFNDRMLLLLSIRHTNQGNDITQVMPELIPDFVNDRSSLLIFDEVQDRPAVYNAIRSMTRGLKCDIIVSGSYLGLIAKRKEFFIPAGDLDYATMRHVSFGEFAQHLTLQPTNNLMHAYWGVGGYPTTILDYFHGSVPSMSVEYERRVESLKSESSRYIEEDAAALAFDVVLPRIVNLLLRGGSTYYAIEHELSGHFETNRRGRYDKKTLVNAINWLQHTGILGTCAETVLDGVDLSVDTAKLFFSDIGMLTYFASKQQLLEPAKVGLQSETFVYNILRSKFKDVYYGTLKSGGEIDFIVSTRSTRYGIEVKHSKGQAKTGQLALKKGYIDKLVYVKGDAGFGETENTITVPMHELEFYDFK